MIQQSLAKGATDFIYKHLTTRYTNRDGILTQAVDKDCIDIIFKSSTNINDKLEEERLMLKAENMSNMIGVIDNVAASPNIPAKVKGEQFLQYWYAELEKNPFLRDILEPMTEEEIKAMNGFSQEGGEEQPVEQPKGKGEESQPQEEPPVEQPKQEVEQVIKQPQEAGTKEEEILRNSFQ